MGKPITDPLADQCGNCKFWDRQPDRKDGGGECCGVPPTPVIMGMRENNFAPGRVDIQMDNMRPVMAPNARPCSLHQRLPSVILGGKTY